MRSREELEVFGLTLMDLLSCGLGGVLILMVIFSSLFNPDIMKNSKRVNSSFDDSKEVKNKKLSFILIEVVKDSENIDLNITIEGEGFECFNTDKTTTKVIFNKSEIVDVSFKLSIIGHDNSQYSLRVYSPLGRKQVECLRGVTTIDYEFLKTR